MKNNRLQIFLALSAALLSSGFLSVSARTFHVDPRLGNNRNDGSSQGPWKTLQEVIDSNKIHSREPVNFPYQWGQPLKEKNPTAPVNAGDTILLRSGYHGTISIVRMYNSDWITIIAGQGQSPEAHHVLLQAACKWRINGLTVSPELGQSTQQITLIGVASHNWSGPVREIVIEGCLAYSALEVNSWDTNTWKARACNGIEVSGRQITIRNNTVKNVNFGISVSDDSVLVEGNTVDRFDGDGLRGVANDLTFRNNLVKNCIVANSANHDDGFQSWSVGAGGVGTGTVYRIRLIGNTIINTTDPAMPLKGTLQGIGCFDGMFENWDVINNVIITDHWHGITLLGARNCRIINNTVCDINTVSPGPPWIMISAHKNGTRSENCVVRNNLTTSLAIDTGSGMVTDHSVIIKNPSDFFIDYPHFDLRLKPGCSAIDSGSTLLAPLADIAGTARPQGAKVDIGAYEYGDGQKVHRHSGAGSQAPAPYVVSVSRRDRSVTFSIVNTTPSAPLRVRIMDIDGQTVKDYGERCGRVITCPIEKSAAGIEIISMRNANGAFFQTIIAR